MGWGSGDEVFDPVCRELVELGASAETKTRVLAKLISALQDRGWDTEAESLSEWEDDSAIVEAFRRNNVFLFCYEDECEKERGHEPPHQDYRGKTW